MVKRLSSERYNDRFVIPRLQGAECSAGIWGCISHKRNGCCKVFTGRINQFTFKETIENELLQSAEHIYGESQAWKFQQDGATAHKALSVQDWFKEQQIEILPWCARSPDLNPIKIIWLYMDAKMVLIKITSVDILNKSWRESYAAKCGFFKY